MFKTADRVKRRYYWPKLHKDVRQFVENFDICKACKPSNQGQRSPMGNLRGATRLFELISIDFVGPFHRSKSGFCCMLVVVCVSNAECYIDRYDKMLARSHILGVWYSTLFGLRQRQSIHLGYIRSS